MELDSNRVKTEPIGSIGVCGPVIPEMSPRLFIPLGHLKTDVPKEVSCQATFVEGTCGGVGRYPRLTRMVAQFSSSAPLAG